MKIEYIKVFFLNDNINIAVEKTISIVDKANETGKKKLQLSNLLVLKKVFFLYSKILFF